jgi:hypothetical protein
LTVVEGIRTQDLESDGPVEADVAGPVDGGEASMVDPFQILVAFWGVVLNGYLRVAFVDHH